MNRLATLLLFALSCLFAAGFDSAPGTLDLFLKVTVINADSQSGKEVAEGLLTALYQLPNLKLMDIGHKGSICDGHYQYLTAFADVGRSMETGLLCMSNTFHVFESDLETPILKVKYEGYYSNPSTLRRATITANSLLQEPENNKQ